MGIHLSLFFAAKGQKQYSIDIMLRKIPELNCVFKLDRDYKHWPIELNSLTGHIY